MEMYRYIQKILASQPTIIMSWGAHEMHPCVVDAKEGLQFRVQGFLHKGLVSVLYNQGSDAFDVLLQDNSGKVLKSLSDVYLSELVDCIDSQVERTADYGHRVKTWFDASDESPEQQQSKDLARLICDVMRDCKAEDIHIIG